MDETIVEPTLTDSANALKVALGFLGLIGLLVLGLILYIVPLATATKRVHPQTSAIVLLNLLLGWTVIGWVIAMVWASRRPRRLDRA